MGHNGCLMFCQITANEERCGSRRIVVVQHPSLVFPQFRSLPAHSNPSNALKLPCANVCLPSDHVVQIHDGQCLSNRKKKQPVSPRFLTDSSLLFSAEETLSPSTATIASWFQHHAHKPTSHLLL